MPRLVSFKLRLVHAHGRLVFADGHAFDVHGEALDNLVVTASSLLVFVDAQHEGAAGAVSVDLESRVLRATMRSSGSPVAVVRVDGERFAQEVLPRCDQVRLWSSRFRARTGRT